MSILPLIMATKENVGTNLRPSIVRWLIAIFLTLRGRLILLICFATVPAILFIFFAASNERESALNRMKIDARHLSGLASREHAHQLNGARNLLNRLASTLPCDNKEQPPICPDYLSTLLSGFPQFANIGITDQTGQVICSAASIQHTANLKTNIAFERALNSTDIETGTYAVGFVGRPVLHLAYAIRKANQTPCAIAFVAVELGWLDQLAKQANLPTDYSLLITDRVGHVLAGSGAVASDLASNQTQSISKMEKALTSPEGAILEIGPSHTARYFVATAMDDVPGIFVIAGLPYEQVQQTANRAFYRTLVGLILVTIFAIASAIFAAEFSILRVLRTLTRTVKRFGAGDLSARAPVPGSHGELRELAVSFSNMADALAIQQRQAHEAQARLRALSHRLQIARDEEAGRIARELHDELGQILTGLKIELSTVCRICSRSNSSSSGDQAIVQMSKQIDLAIDSVRRISSELRPAVLDRLGLVAAIDWLVRDCESKTKLAIAFSVNHLQEPIDGLISTALFRIVQEAFTNIIRHANATEVTVNLASNETELVLTIHDNGKGIEVSETEGIQSLGILGMRERTHLLGGSFLLQGEPSKGTTIVVEVPREPPHLVEWVHV